MPQASHRTPRVRTRGPSGSAFDQYLLDIHDVGRYVACGGEGGADTCGDCVILTMEQSPGSLGGLCKHK